MAGGQAWRAAWLVAAVAVAPAAQAQTVQAVGDNFVQPSLPIDYDRGRNTGVLDRPRPEYEAPGIRLGGFVLHPRAQITIGYTDNVYDTPAKTGDGFVDLAPSATLASNWSRDALGLDAGASFRRFFSQTRRDQDGWHVGANGRYDIGGSTTITAQVRTERATEPATSAAYPTAAATASQYQVTTALLAPAYAFGRIKLQGAYNFTTYSFSPVTSFAGTTIDQSNRDSTDHALTGRGEYAISPDTSLFLQGNYDHLTYSHDLTPGVANRNANSYRGLGGVSFDIAAKVRGAVGIGYMTRDYVSILYRRIGGLTAEARFDYFVDALTTLTLTGRRVVEDAGFNPASTSAGGFINNSVALRMDHEVLRNLLLDAQAGYEHDSFTGTPASLDIVRLSAGAHYLASRALGFGLAVTHDSRAANAAPGLTAYAETRVELSLVAQQ